MCTVTLIPLEPASDAAGNGGEEPPAAAGGRKHAGTEGVQDRNWAAGLVKRARAWPGVRLVCNRDESRARPEAFPPQVLSFGRRKAIMPIDPLEAGTWIAVSDAGLVMTLLNVNERESMEEPEQAVARGFGTFANSEHESGRLASRGGIIPSLLHAADLDAAFRLALSLESGGYRPFRLVFTDGIEVAEVRSDRERLRHSRGRLAGEPCLFTSSGLGDHLVEPPRRALFEERLGPGADLVARQDAFHRHSWPDRPHLSVCMSRPDARTVSHTAIELGGGIAQLTYCPEPPDRTCRPAVVTLELERVPAP